MGKDSRDPGNKEKSMIHPQLGQNHRLLFLKDPKWVQTLENFNNNKKLHSWTQHLHEWSYDKKLIKEKMQEGR